jgi:probable O-glycosylation ligase (exosortase A-associated)
VPLTALVWIIAYGGGAVLSFVVHPIYGLFAYFLDYYGHPPLRWWGKALPRLRWSLIISLITFVAYLLKRNQIPALKITNHPQTKWLLLFVICTLLITISPLAVWPAESWEGTMTIMKFAALYFLITKIVRTKEHFCALVLVHILGVFWWGWNAFENPKRSSGRLIAIGGADTYHDNFAAAHLLGVLPFIGAGFFTGKWWEKIICLVAAPFVLNTFILCNSRGAFLAMLFAGGVALLITKGAVRRNILIALLLGGVLFYQLMDPTFIQRQQTIQSYEEDNSATGRLTAWKGAVKLIQDYPLGTGGGGYDFLSPIYIPEIVEAHGGELRTVHNTYLQAASEWGIQGFILFMGFFLSTLRELHGIRKREIQTPEGKRIALESVAITLGLCGVLAASMFINRVYGEILYVLPALAAALKNIHAQEAEVEAAETATEAKKGDRES